MPVCVTVSAPPGLLLLFVLWSLKLSDVVDGSYCHLLSFSQIFQSNENPEIQFQRCSNVSIENKTMKSIQ